MTCDMFTLIEIKSVRKSTQVSPRFSASSVREPACGIQMLFFCNLHAVTSKLASLSTQVFMQVHTLHFKTCEGTPPAFLCALFAFAVSCALRALRKEMTAMTATQAMRLLVTLFDQFDHLRN